MIKTYIIMAIVTIAVVSAVVYSFTTTGSPTDARQEKFDQDRVTGMNSLKYAVEDYYYTNKSLPGSLADIKNNKASSYYSQSYTDPETGKDYEYEKKTELTYQLCVTFSTSNEKATAKDKYSGYSDPTFKHPKGHKCFDLEIKVAPTTTPAPYF